MAPVGKILRYTFSAGAQFLKAALSGKGLYRYSFRDLWHGALLSRRGYARVTAIEKRLGDDGPFVDVDIDGRRVSVLKALFKPGELAWLYQETFGEYPSNPHSYRKGNVVVEPGDLVIDAGACEGFFVRLALESRCGHVYAFEPYDPIFQGLSRTFRGDDRVTVVSSGLSGSTGRGRIASGADYVCEAKIDEDGTDEVPLTTLDAFVRDMGLPRVDFIKMDIEGSEYKAIEGARNVLRKFVPKLAIAVYHEYEMAEKLKNLILEINPDYHVEFGGCYMMAEPFRPFLLYAFGRR